jgi:K+-sensing histidine kinase KdpD
MAYRGEVVRLSRTGVISIVTALCLMAAATAILWQLKVTTGSKHLVYLYLLPVLLIAVLNNGRLALLCAVIAIVGADYFLQEPLYSLAVDNALQYGDLICFAVLAALAIKCIREFIRPRAKILKVDRYR